ncbi:MAG: rRNA pseudouridine synthase [Lachnospiraceae bacterium]|nr:rRNA pseudouridine synthase [Lachnospiraceae bacterium]
MMQETVRLNKYLASAGVCSRREADRLIEEGAVSVDGRIAPVGCKVSGQETITVSGRLIERPGERVVLAFYKPVGVVCSTGDPHAEKTIFDVLDYKRRLTYAGRLDKDSEGLLLMTDDGDLIERMMRSSGGHEKEYEVDIDKPVTEDFLAKMRAGIYLKELERTTLPCRVEKTGEKSFSIILTQGMNRQIRRMCQSCGCRVIRLKRVRVVNVMLEDLKPGQYRELDGKQIDQLKEALRMDEKAMREKRG